MRSSPRIGIPPRRLARGFRRAPDSCSFLGNIDPDGTPGYATPTADTPGAAKLINPVGQLMRHPLAVARARRIPHAAAVDVGKIQCETGIPAAHALGGRTGEIGRVVDCRAEASRTYIGAIAAGEAASGDLVPPRVVGIGLKQFLYSVGIELSSHLTPGAVDNSLGGGDFLRGCRPLRQIPDHVRTRGASDVDHEKMTALLDELRQGQVETGLDLWSGIHRDTETGAARLTAIDRHDEGAVAALLIILVEVLTPEKDPVLDGDRAQFTGAHADKGERSRCFLALNDREIIALATGLPEPLDRGMQKPFPGMGPHGIAEQCRVGAPLNSVPRGILPIGPSDGEIFETLDSFVDDGAVAHGRAYNSIPAIRQTVDDLLQVIPLDSELGAEHLCRSLVRRSLLFNHWSFNTRSGYFH